MEVANARRATRLVTTGRRATGFLDRGLGLMFRRRLARGEGLLIEPCSSIHSCFMRFRFDAAFLDANGRILHVVHRMAPWRVSRIVPGARAVLELPAGTLEETHTEVGDVLELLG